jgi:hypothetical protein
MEHFGEKRPEFLLENSTTINSFYMSKNSFIGLSAAVLVEQNVSKEARLKFTKWFSADEKPFTILNSLSFIETLRYGVFDLYFTRFDTVTPILNMNNSKVELLEKFFKKLPGVNEFFMKLDEEKSRDKIEFATILGIKEDQEDLQKCCAIFDKLQVNSK